MYLPVFLKYGLVVFFLCRHCCGTPFGCHLKNRLLYDVSVNFTQPQKGAIYSFMRYIEKKTCVRWHHYKEVRVATVPRITFIYRDTIDKSRGTNCYTKTIYKTGSAEVYLHKTCFPTEILHEIMHAMGFKHEHQRRDRNCYVSVSPGVQSSFSYEILNTPVWIEQFPYDKMSVTHYPLDGEIQCVNQVLGDTCPLGNDGTYLSPMDIWKIKYKYCDAPHFCDIYPDACKQTQQFEDLFNCTVPRF